MPVVPSWATSRLGGEGEGRQGTNVQWEGRRWEFSLGMELCRPVEKGQGSSTARKEGSRSGVWAEQAAGLAYPVLSASRREALLEEACVLHLPAVHEHVEDSVRVGVRHSLLQTGQHGMAREPQHCVVRPSRLVVPRERAEQADCSPLHTTPTPLPFLLSSPHPSLSQLFSMAGRSVGQEERGGEGGGGEERGEVGGVVPMRAGSA